MSTPTQLGIERITLAHIHDAQKRIQNTIYETPLKRSSFLEARLGFTAPVFLKLENLQRTGSFKVRGGANKILSLAESGQRPTHIVAASAGNHAQAVAFVAGRLGIPSTIVMPEGAPLVKAAATADYGARVILHGVVYDDAYTKAQEVLRETPGAVYVHAYEDPEVICGQGTLGLEVDAQLRAQGVDASDLQAIVPIGGGGLFCGVGTALQGLRPGTQMFGVVSEAAPAVAESFRAGRLMASAGRSRTLAEGLAVKKVSPLTFAIISKMAREVAVVTDDEIAVAIATLMERSKLVVEGAGAAGVAAAMAGRLPLDPHKPAVFILCGGNIDMNLVSNILERGLSKAGRWLSLTVRIEDKPGELARVAAIIGRVRGNVLEVNHDRISGANPVGYTSIHFQLETRGPAHAEEIRAALTSEGYQI